MSLHKDKLTTFVQKMFLMFKKKYHVNDFKCKTLLKGLVEKNRLYMGDDSDETKHAFSVNFLAND